MKKGLTSIIMTCYDQTQTARHISMAAVAAINRYTKQRDYELIIVDCCPKYPFRDDYKVLKIDQFIEVPAPDIGYYPAMNLGARHANGEYFCFIENDVFVSDNWLTNLRWCLENNRLDAVMPHQIPNTFEQTLEFYLMDFDEAIGKAATEQGLVLITRKAFRKIHGWDRKLKAGYGWKRFYQQLQENGVRLGNTAKAMITHITGACYYDTMEFDPKKHAKNSRTEAKYLNG